jgi:hypothetical protein
VTHQATPHRDGLALCIVLAAVTVIAALLFTGRANASEQSRTFEVLQSFARHHTDQDEPEAERTARLQETADAIDTATRSSSERALLLSLGWHESRWASYVHNDAPRCREGLKGHCDRGLAWSPWQLHATDRTGGVAEAARVALTRIRQAANHCGGTGEERTRRALSLYATGNTCEWSGAAERVVTWRRMVARLGGGQ